MALSADFPVNDGSFDPVIGPARVFLVGAGPGNPGLLTLRGRDLLARADLVLYDRLVCQELLDHCRPDSERICVSELPGTHPEKWPEILKVLVEKAQSGQIVVRLKGGDPFLFGRGAEECQALVEAGIPFEVVPGVSAGLGATAWAGIPLTQRHTSSAVAWVTAHETPGKGNLLDAEALSRFPGTLVFFMPLKQLETWQRHLIQYGLKPQTPVALIEKGTWNSQKVAITTLDEVVVKSQDFRSPTLLVVGEVVGFHETLDWSGRRPLSGCRILLTRPTPQASSTLDLFRRWGAVAENQPLVELDPIEPNPPLTEAIATLEPGQWVVFASQMGVKRFFHALFSLGKDPRHLAGVRLACIGPATATAVKEYHLQPDLVAKEHSSEGLARAILETPGGNRVLLIRADRGREVLSQVLGSRADVQTVVAYRHRDVADWPEARWEELKRGQWDWVVLGSSSIAQGYCRLLRQPNRQGYDLPKIAAISPITASVVRDLGFKVDLVAEDYTMLGVMQALVKCKNHRK